MIFDYKRQEQIYHLISARKTAMRAERIAEELGVSSRTIRSDIHLINEKLADYGAEIAIKRGSGYQLHIFDIGKYESFQNEYEKTRIHDYFDISQPEERAKYIIYLLLMEKSYVKLDDLAEQIYTSRATISNDMKQVRNYLTKHGLVLVSKTGKGLKIEGSEKKIRYCLTELIASVETDNYLPSFFNWRDKGSELQKLSSAVEAFFVNKHIKFTDEALQNLLLHLMIILERTENNLVLEDFKIVDNDKEVEEIARELLSLLSELFHVSFTKADEKYLVLQITSKRIFQPIEIENVDQDVNQFIEDLLLRIKSLYSYDLTKDNQLTTDLISHVHSMLYRVKNKLIVRNPMKEHIKRYYPLAYEITLNSAEYLKEKYPYKVNNNELAYLALHIGASLERNYEISYYRHKSALIVCGSGLGTARIVEARVRTAISGIDITKTVSIREYNSFSHIEDDIVISTVKIEEKNKKVIQVSPIPTKEELKFLEKAVEQQMKPYPTLLEKFFGENFFIRTTSSTKEEILKKMAQILERENVIYSNFLESVMERESLGSTILGTDIAIPHPMGLRAKETKISIAILEEPIEWYEDQKVQVIFLLAISKEDYEEAIEIYELLVELVRAEYLPKILKCKNYQDFKLVAEQVLDK